MADIISIDELCHKFDQNLSTELKPKVYNTVIDDIFDKAKNKKPQKDLEKVEEVLERSYQDHSETRQYLAKRIKEDINLAIDLFESLPTRSIHVLVGCFNDAHDSIPLTLILKERIRLGTDPNIHSLLGCVVQLLNKFKYKFEDMKFLVRELCLRIKEKEVESLTLVIFTQLSSSFKDEFDTNFLEFMDALIFEAESDIGEDPLYQIIDILKELYPALTALCSSVVLGKKLDKLLAERVSRGDNDEFIKSLLSLLSVACIDENVRVHISDNYMSILEKSLDNEKFKIYTVLVLIKTWSFTKLKDVDIHKLTTILVSSFLNNIERKNKEFDIAIEGLAYLSLKTSVKLLLRHNTNFMPEVQNIVKDNIKDENFYGVLIILANLSSLPDDSNSGNKSIRDLKDYSDLKNPNIGKKMEDTVQDDKSAVIQFNKDYILDTELLSELNAKFTTFSQGSRGQLIRIIYNLTRTREHISKCVEQGSTTSVLKYLLGSKNSSSGTGHKNEEIETLNILAIRSLTRILIYTNPTLIFNKYSPLNAIPFLFQFLPIIDTTDLGEEHNVFLKNSEQLTGTDQVEALLSLTNIASSNGSDGEDICKTIVSTPKYWTVIENLILDDNPIIQRSTLELICNLMNHPVPLASKFFNFENPQSLRNFNILVKLLLLDDIKSQRAVVAIFANIANTIPFIAEALLKQDELIKNCVNIFADQMDDVELRQRLIMLFYALFELAPQVGDDSEKDFERVIKFDECEKLQDALKVSMTRADTNPEFSDVVPTILAKFEQVR